ncbi:MAG: T9SS type A sorting domain-containing protein [Bacteroidales bacterium]|nr:T9SS type A sorting domain-containing protein [Bacteroidales bacterium]MBR6162242.1 T9SS type A sorting domain-containing protein [Bacteroidales bacterium]
MKRLLLVLLAVMSFGWMSAQEFTGSVRINKAFPDDLFYENLVRNYQDFTAIPMPEAQVPSQPVVRTGAPYRPVTQSKRILAPGEALIFAVDGNTVTEETDHLGNTFSADIENAISKVPEWLQYDLRFKFKVVTTSSVRNKMVTVINNAPKKYLDEVAYVVTYLPVEVLSGSRLPSDWSYLIDNARWIYTHADSLQYVQIVEHGDTTTQDWYTTTQYRIKQGSNYIWREVDRYYYYQFLVMPKLEQEVLAITDNLTSISSSRTWGYFWRDYLWNDYSHAVNTADTAYRGYKNVNTWGYVAINSSGARDTVRIDTIPRLGEIMQMPTYLWDENPTIYFFNRPFSATQSALNVLGNWASRCVPQDVTSSNDYRPSEPNHIAWKHVGNCHEDALLVVAAARTALIPCIHVADLCDDHVWAAIHDGGDSIWHHFEFFRGGCSANRPYYWGMTNMQANGNYGWNSSLVQGYVPDGHLLNLSETYSDQTPCTLNLTITDQDGYPVDGARVNLYSTNTQYGTEYKLSAGYLWTDAQGKISVKLGTGKKYYFKITHSKYGSFPETSGQIYVLISSNTAAGNVYNRAFQIPASAQSPRFQITSTQEAYEAQKSLQINLDARNVTSDSNPEDAQSSTFYERTNDLAGLRTYVVSESEMASFRNATRTGNVEFDFGSLSDGTFNIPTHTSGRTYVVLANLNNFKNYIEVSYDAQVVDGAEFPSSSGVTQYDNAKTEWLQAYPNPVADVLNYTVSEQLLGTTVQLVDMTGRVVAESKITHLEGSISMNHLDAGVYLLRAGSRWMKVLKK